MKEWKEFARFPSASSTRKATKIHNVCTTHNHEHPENMAEHAKFTLFPQLPTEIRLQIWRDVFFSKGPRIVEVLLQKHDCVISPRGQQACPIYSPTPPPPVFLVCHEARRVALELASNAGRFLVGDKSIVFDPSMDTIYVPCNREHSSITCHTVMHRLEFADRAIACGIRSVAIELDPEKKYVQRDVVCAYRLKVLEELIFVVAKGDEDYGDEIIMRYDGRLRKRRRKLGIGRLSPGEMSLPPPPPKEHRDFTLSIKTYKDLDLSIPIKVCNKPSTSNVLGAELTGLRMVDCTTRKPAGFITACLVS
jgi:hypothetical protein